MRLRGPLISTGALGLAVLAVAVVGVWTSVSRTRSAGAMAVTTTIRVNGTENVFAPAAVRRHAHHDRRAGVGRLLIR